MHIGFSDRILFVTVRYRLLRFGIIKPKEGVLGRRAKKDIKNRQKKVRGKDKAKIAGTQKK